jgi:biopolymer transport protein ExbD
MAVGKLPGSDDDEGAGDGIFAEINITPLTDIFLVLLIIFMVTSTVIVEGGSRGGVKVNLPKGSAQEVVPSAHSLIVSILADGTVIVRGAKESDADLATVFEQTAAEDPDTQIIIEGDAIVPHGRVVQVMEAAKSAGLSRIAIATSAAK